VFVLASLITYYIRLSFQLIINLDGENLHTPYFPGTVYPTETDISEDLSIDSTVVQGKYN